MCHLYHMYHRYYLYSYLYLHLYLYLYLYLYSHFETYVKRHPAPIMGTDVDATVPPPMNIHM